MELSPELVRREYEAGLRFNRGIDLYDCVRTNEDFFIGRQWEGVQANGLPTPVFNFLKRVTNFAVANVAADNLKINARPMNACGEHPEAEAELLAEIVNGQFGAICEQNKLGEKIRQFARNAAVDGDGCLYAWWDPRLETGHGGGGVRVEALQNTQVMFGNPNCREVEEQPYILIEKRMTVADARRLCENRGAAADITQDDPEGADGRFDRLGGGRVTVLTRLWRDRQSGTVHGYQCTAAAEIRKPWDLGIRRYPLCWMSWDYVQDCYHGQAMLTGLIPNQIFVNKLFAMSMISMMSLAYPKVIYDSGRIAKWSARVGAAIGVSGDIDGAAKILEGASVSPQIGQFIDLAVGYTQKFLGGSDAALGDVRPENTSAIIALQRAAATPMELTKQSLLQAVEDLGRVFMEFMAAYYGLRPVEVRAPKEDGGGKVVIPFDFSALKGIHCAVELDVGAGSYWSEIAAMQTLDNLLVQEKISTVEYLKRLPAGYISDREALIEAMERDAAKAAAPVPAAPADMAEQAAGTVPVQGG